MVGDGLLLLYQHFESRGIIYVYINGPCKQSIDRGRTYQNGGSFQFVNGRCSLITEGSKFPKTRREREREQTSGCIVYFLFFWAVCFQNNSESMINDLN